MQTHYFLAVPLPKKLKEDFRTYIEELKDIFSFSSWVHPADLHLTLAFLGNMKNEDKRRISEKMHCIANDHRSFPLTLERFHTFGNSQSPRIFWQGVEESVPLLELRKQVFDACEELGFQLDQRPFHPHITLARKWKGAGLFSEDTLTMTGSKKEAFQVHEFVLYQTHLDRLPKYEAIERYKLH